MLVAKSIEKLVHTPASFRSNRRAASGPGFLDPSCSAGNTNKKINNKSTKMVQHFAISEMSVQEKHVTF